MKIKELYEHYNFNYAEICRELKVGTTTMQNWQKRGFIPIRSQMILEKRSNGLFKASIEDAQV